MTYREAGKILGVKPNMLRYAALTGTVSMRWEGAGQPVVWIIPPPDVAPAAARLELAHRFLHVFGPSTPEAFARWAGISARYGAEAFDAMGATITPVRTPLGDSWVLSEDESSLREGPGSPAAARLLPSGDAFTLLQGDDREILMPDADHRMSLWPSRVWPGAVLVEGEVVGTWRRTGETMTVTTWHKLSRVARDAIEAEAASLPIPDRSRDMLVRWQE